MKRYVFFPVFILIFSAGIFSTKIFSDLLPEGKKRIQYSFELTNIDSYPGYTFIAYPVNNSNGAPYITANILSQNKPVQLACKFGVPVIYAVKNEDFNKAEFDSVCMIDESSPRSEKLNEFIQNGKFIPSLKIICDSYANRDAKYNFVNEQFGIESINNDTMIIKSQKTLYKDNNNNTIDAKDSKSGFRDDVVSPQEQVGSYLIIVIPILALIAIITVLVLRKMKK